MTQSLAMPIFDIEWADKTDWRKLQRQKKALVEVMSELPENDARVELLNGLLNFMDAVQDWAADVYGIPGEIVFDR